MVLTMVVIRQQTMICVPNHEKEIFYGIIANRGCNYLSDSAAIVQRFDGRLDNVIHKSLIL